ncbi:MAG: hypothetical protein NC111_05260 [Bacteroides sp.]|nr:hypothetical protein [Bacteroides sp.]MCM1413398.1 hypothetical protein [Bacteroides sp.]MCM1471916.1 hypothetical protein [Bacteroides sp.]
MEQQIRHRRLHAFYNSKTLGILTIVGITFLLLTRCMQPLLGALICAAASFALFVGYSLWIWIKKPAHLVINRWLSNTSTWFVLYFLFIEALDKQSWWWYILPAIAAIILIFIDLVKPHDEMFDINTERFDS